MKRLLSYRFGLAGLAFGFSFVLAFQSMLHSWDGVVTVSRDQLRGISGRIPAALHPKSDLIKIDGELLRSATKERLLTAAQVAREPGGIKLHLQQFLVSSPDGGQTMLACDLYDRMSLKLVAEGIASSGETPVMEIEAPCRTSSEITRIQPVYIPTAEILQLEPADQHSSFSSASDSTFIFSKVNMVWPKKWSLQSVRLFRSDNPDAQLIVANDGTGKTKTVKIDW